MLLSPTNIKEKLKKEQKKAFTTTEILDQVKSILNDYSSQEASIKNNLKESESINANAFNFELLEKAWVWLYPWSRFESLEQKHLFIETQEHNKINKRGVWGSRILKPWKYRKKRRRGKI